MADQWIRFSHYIGHLPFPSLFISFPLTDCASPFLPILLLLLLHHHCQLGRASVYHPSEQGPSHPEERRRTLSLLRKKGSETEKRCFDCLGTFSPPLLTSQTQPTSHSLSASPLSSFKIEFLSPPPSRLNPCSGSSDN